MWMISWLRANTGKWGFGGQWEWECLTEYMMVIRKLGAYMRRLSVMDTRKQKEALET